jgi:large subunit ribosomal protein L31
VRPNIHPESHRITVTCACGNKIETLSTKKDVTIDICNACHPYFTGKQRLVDTAGRVERFKKKHGLS